VHRFQNLVIDRMLEIDRIPEGDAVEQVPLATGERVTRRTGDVDVQLTPQEMQVA